MVRAGSYAGGSSGLGGRRGVSMVTCFGPRLIEKPCARACCPRKSRSDGSRVSKATEAGSSPVRNSSSSRATCRRRVGVGGPASQVALLGRLGVPARLEAGVDRAKVAREVQAGRPAIVRLVGEWGHYMVAERYDPSSGRFDFGQSALVLKASGGRRWFGLDELKSLRVGAPTDTIYLADAAGAPPGPPPRGCGRPAPAGTG